MHTSRVLLLTLLAAVGLPLLLTLSPERASGIRAGAPPPADVSIEITDAGFSPSTVLVTAGANIHWTNHASGNQSVAAESGLFDSATLAPGDGFSINLKIPGHHAYHSANNPAFTGVVKVVVPGLEGPQDALAKERIPDIDFPTVDTSEIAEHPTLAIAMSRTRIYAGFTDSATVGQANAALQNAGVGFVGGIPEFKTIMVEVPDSGDFTNVDAAVAALRAQPAIAFAAYVISQASESVPRVWASANDANLASNTWDVLRTAAGDPVGRGDNYQLEIARVPQAWSLLEAVRNKAGSVDTGILDVDGYAERHEDLAALTPRPLCSSTEPAVCTTNRGDLNHATHVAGIVGATYDNPAP